VDPDEIPGSYEGLGEGEMGVWLGSDGANILYGTPDQLEKWAQVLVGEVNAHRAVLAEAEAKTLVMQVEGREFGGQYWGDATFRVKLTHPTAETYGLVVEDSSGTEVGDAIVFDYNQADRLVALANTSEEADDAGLGLTHEFHWRLGDSENEVDLTSGHLEQIAEWINDPKETA
jgi:hypothetical protein